MRFMMLMIPKGYRNATPGTFPKAEDVAKMMRYNEELQRAGVLISVDGLHPPAEGARVTFTRGKATVTKGPFTNANETLGGFWIIKAASLEEAVDWARRAPVMDDTIEVRRIQEMEDFPEDVRAAVAGFAEMQTHAGKGDGS